MEVYLWFYDPCTWIHLTHTEQDTQHSYVRLIRRFNKKNNTVARKLDVEEQEAWIVAVWEKRCYSLVIIHIVLLLVHCHCLGELAVQRPIFSFSIHLKCKSIFCQPKHELQTLHKIRLMEINVYSIVIITFPTRFKSFVSHSLETFLSLSILYMNC